MFVVKRMTPSPITVCSTATVADASELMRVNKFRRLPVVDKGKLVGIVTDRDLREVSPSPATTLSIFELNYLLAKMQVKDIMKRDVVTIDQNATIEEAALVMYNNKIGGLIVVDGAEQVVGIITETDIFKTFVDLMGLPQGKTRLTLSVSGKVGVLHAITGVFRDLGISISSMAIYLTEEDKGEIVIRADIDDIRAVTERLAAIGYPVIHVAQIGQ